MTDDNGVEIRIERLSSRVSVLESRVESAEDWVGKSQEFHVEMRKNWDRLIGAQEATEKLAKQRHQENVDRMERIQASSTIWNLVIGFFGLVCAACMLYLAIKSAGHADIDPSKLFHAKEPAGVYANSQKPQTAVQPMPPMPNTQ